MGLTEQFVNAKKVAQTTAKPAQTFTVPLKLDARKSPEEREIQRITFVNDNYIFLNSCWALLRDLDKPFVTNDALQQFLDFLSSKRPELKDRANTLRYIRDNRAKWFKDGSLNSKVNALRSIFEYVDSNEVLLERGPEYLGEDVNLNYAVNRALADPNFSLKNPQNPIRTSWDNMAVRLKKVFQPQNLYER